MMITFAFYKAPGTVINKTIRGITGSKHSHCEVIFEGNQWFSMGTRWKDGLKARFKDIYAKPGHWDFIDIEVDRLAYLAAYEFAKSIVGARYDIVAIPLTHVLPLGISVEGTFTCSHVCTLIGQIAHFPELFPLQPHKQNPGELFGTLSTQYTVREG